MSENKHIPEFKSYDEMAEFWDTHSLSDYCVKGERGCSCGNSLPHGL